MGKFQKEMQQLKGFGTLNNIVLSSNLFMNEEATTYTLSRIPNLSPETSIVIINNAEPAYGITTVNGFKERGFDQVTEITVSTNEIEQQRTLLSSADVVVLTGGNPWRLLQDLRKTDALLFVRNDAVLVGVSAGAMILGKSIDFLHKLAPSYNENNEYQESEGYNLLKGKNVIPHVDEGYYVPEVLNEFLEFQKKTLICLSKNDQEVTH